MFVLHLVIKASEHRHSGPLSVEIFLSLFARIPPIRIFSRKSHTAHPKIPTKEPTRKQNICVIYLTFTPNSRHISLFSNAEIGVKIQRDGFWIIAYLAVLPRRPDFSRFDGAICFLRQIPLDFCTLWAWAKICQSPFCDTMAGGRAGKSVNMATNNHNLAPWK